MWVIRGKCYDFWLLCIYSVSWTEGDRKNHPFLDTYIHTFYVVLFTIVSIQICLTTPSRFLIAKPHRPRWTNTSSDLYLNSRNDQTSLRLPQGSTLFCESLSQHLVESGVVPLETEYKLYSYVIKVESIFTQKVWVFCSILPGRDSWKIPTKVGILHINNREDIVSIYYCISKTYFNKIDRLSVVLTSGPVELYHNSYCRNIGLTLSLETVSTDSQVVSKQKHIGMGFLKSPIDLCLRLVIWSHFWRYDIQTCPMILLRLFPW